MKSEIFNYGLCNDHWTINKLTANNVKKTSFFLIAILIGYHGILHLTSGVKSCKWLLSDGNFHGFGSYRVWQPYGCMMHTYSRLDIRRCIKYIAYWGGQNHIVFMGESRVRQLYYQLIKSICLNSHQITDSFQEEDLEYVEKEINLLVRFLWRPKIDQSVVDEFVRWANQKDSRRPSIVMIGSAAYNSEFNKRNSTILESFKRNLTRLLPYLEALNHTTSVLWMLQEPIFTSDLKNNIDSAIMNEQIDLYNRIATEALSSTNVNTVHIWSSARLISLGFKDARSQNDTSSRSSFRVHPNSLKFSIQILLNLYCNDQMNYNDGTCCSDPERYTLIQLIVLALLATDNSDSIGMLIDNLNEENKNVKNNSTKHELIFLFGKLGAIMIYCFLCDRTNFFMKENKYYSRPNFLLPILYVFALGIFFTDESSHFVVLHSDQTNEIKGWMQLIILAYHYTGASQVLPIYITIRLLVSFYLFLSGFGHFTYFWTTNDLSFERFCKVIFRLNFLAVCLCLCMNRPYQFYYFVPLVSFWFFVIYSFFKIIPVVTETSSEANSSHYFYLILKFITLFALISILYTSEVFFESLFLIRPWKFMFVSNDDSIKEWWFRWRIDRYSVLCGMISAFCLQMLRKYRIIHESNPHLFSSTRLNILMTISTIIGLFVSATIMINHSIKLRLLLLSFSSLQFFYVLTNPIAMSFTPMFFSFRYDSVSVLLSTIILSFVVLRNNSKWFRIRFSVLFSWFGRISLELFLCQYHIWLAADTHGILVLIPSYPVLNVIITSFIFISIAHEMHAITNRFSQYSITNDWRFTLRNLIILFLILITFRMKDGIF
ncbi:CAS1 domain-containing protein [Sarcoptes scabiei]|uniref:CAS1 domain-containing protein n=1 Tax=Sarcoptes scabiei TaxID=52283 RepID=A0A131ZVM7_SARSC|nr:CAS1 domain-containing protein [Sarcoptes scabiei]